VTRRAFIDQLTRVVVGLGLAPSMVNTLLRRADAESLTRPFSFPMIDAIDGTTIVTHIAPRVWVCRDDGPADERPAVSLGDGIYAVDLTEADTAARVVTVMATHERALSYVASYLPIPKGCLDSLHG